MAKFFAIQFYDPVFAGEYGNLSAKAVNITAAAAIADTIDFMVLPGKCRLLDWAMQNAALGAGSTISVGWRYADGTAGGSATALLPATSTAAAARTTPLTNTGIPIDVDKDIIVYGTVAGGAVAGRVDLRVEYEFRGTL
jgi:hypothetical protein